MAIYGTIRWMLTELEKIKWYKHAGLWAFAICLVILTFTGVLARITLNLQGATLTNPDLAIYTLLEDEIVYHADLIRESETERHYVVESSAGTRLVILEKDQYWKVAEQEALR